MTTVVHRRVFQQALWILAALFAIVWAVVRACVQSITMDEALTYLSFVVRSDIWSPSANNHILNSLLMWMTTHAFGTSNITVRAPALLGGIVYICACYVLCRNIADRFSLQFPIFICLIYNPFLFDFMVAARGYSLANAFLLVAIAVPLWHTVKGGLSLRTSCILASLALGLSFTANFAFAFVDIAAFLGLVTWATTLARQRRESESIVRVVEFCTLPGLAVALLLCGYALEQWKREELWWGAHSFREMAQSLVASSLYQPDLRFLGPRRFREMLVLKPLLLPLLGILCFCQLVVTRLDGSWRADSRARWLGWFTLALIGILALPVLIHGLAFHFANVPLPMGRTGIYLVPLFTLLAGTIAASPARSLVSRWLRSGITAVFICLGCYFLLCIRLSYFVEYKWNAEVKDVYSVLARLNHTYGVTEVAANGLFLNALNYYRALSKGETFPEFTVALSDPDAGRPAAIYILYGTDDRKLIATQKLAVIYDGRISDVAIAVKADGRIPRARLDP